jgi:cytochrome b561
MSRPNVDVAPVEFDPVIKLLHWLTLFLIVAVFVLAFSVDHVPAGAKGPVLQLHRSIGLTILVVTFGRLIWRQFTRFPNWPADMTRVMRVATSASEYLLYVLLLIQPVLGLIHTNARGDKVNLFFLGNLPALIGPDRPFARQVHEVHDGGIHTPRRHWATRGIWPLPPFLAPRPHACRNAAERNIGHEQAGGTASRGVARRLISAVHASR